MLYKNQEGVKYLCSPSLYDMCDLNTAVKKPNNVFAEIETRDICIIHKSAGIKLNTIKR